MTNDRLDVVFVFLDSGDKNLYQLRYWVQTLQRLAAHRDVTVLHASEEAASLLKSTSLQAVRVELPEGLVAFLNEKRPRLLLYPNQNVRNFYALRYGQGLHAWVSHGESEKAYMFQNTLKRYDLYFAAGQAAAADPIVKKSDAGICHDKNSSSYERTKKFTEFKTVDECVKSGGTLPKK